MFEPFFKYSNYGPIVYNWAMVYIHQNFLKVVAHVIFIDQWNQTAHLYEIQVTVVNGDLVYKFRKNILVLAMILALFRKIILRYIKIGYSINVIQQTACMVVNPICFPLWLHAAGCTDYDGSGLKFLSKSVGAWCSGRAHRCPTAGFLLLQHFSYFLLSSPHCCFISVFVWCLCSRRCCTDELENPSRRLNKCLCVYHGRTKSERCGHVKSI